ncbi:MAG: hypothetical protein ACRC1K_00850, partial [Planctomycetia bacterium]
MNVIYFFTNLINGTIYAIQAFFSALLSPFRLVQPAIKLTAGTRLVLELLLVAGVVVGLAFLGLWLGLDRQIPVQSVPLKRFWLGFVALLVYLVVRLILYIVAQLPGAKEEFPDIDRALEAGMAALAEERLPINDVPLFLVVGLRPGQESAFARSDLVGRKFRVDGQELPVHWFGDERAVWASLPGVSAVDKQVEAARKPTRSAAGLAKARG